MQNLLVLTSSFPKRENSHEARFIFSQVKKISEHEFNVTVIAPHFPCGKIQERWGKICIDRFVYSFPLSFERLTYGSGILFNIKKDPFTFFSVVPFCISELLWSLKKIFTTDIDLIHTHWLVPQGLIGAFLHRLSNIPHVATVHGSDLNILKKYTLLHPVCRFITSNSVIITVNSNYMKQQLLAISPNCERKIQVIPMGIDLMQFCSSGKLNIRSYYQTNHIIFSAGRLIEIKGIAYLIDAMPDILTRFPDTRLLIAGDGPEKESLIQKIHMLNLDSRVTLLGLLSPQDIIGYYHSADVFVLPSIQKFGMTEALGVVLLEAMASGCPVIGSNVGGIPDIITDGENGFLVPEQNPNALAEKISRIFSDTELREKFRKNGYSRIRESFTWDKVTEDFLSVYNQSIANTSTSEDQT